MNRRARSARLTLDEADGHGGDLQHVLVVAQVAREHRGRARHEAAVVHFVDLLPRLQDLQSGTRIMPVAL